MSARGFAVRASGAVVEILDAAGDLALTLTFALPGETPTGFEPDDADLALTEGDGVQARLTRFAQGDVERFSVTLDNSTAEPVEPPYLGVGVTVGASYVGWVWSSDANGLVVVRPTRSLDAGFALTLAHGFFRAALGPVTFPAEAEPRVGVHLCPPGVPIGAHRRFESVLVLRPADAGEGAWAPPGWLPQLIEPAGTAMVFGLPDAALVPGPGVSVQIADTDQHVTGAPGHREVSVQGAEQGGRLALTWSPEIRTLVAAAVTELVRRRPQQASDAAGAIVAEALWRGWTPDPDHAVDWLEQVDWLRRGTLLATYTAGQLALSQRERGASEAVWTRLAELPIEPGYGIALVKLWLAELGWSERTEAAQRLLAGRPNDATGDLALEFALLGHPVPSFHRRVDPDLSVLDIGLLQLAARLGDDLPGRPLGLDAVTAARAITMLRMTPETSWVALPAAITAEKARRLLLADHAGVLTGEDWTADLAGLAWLLVGETAN